MLAKIIVHGADRADGAGASCAPRWRSAAIAGIETNLEYLRQVIARSGVRSGRHHHRLTCAASTIAAAPSTSSIAACRPPCRTIPAASATGMSACRLPVRWTRWRSALANRLVGNAEARGGPRDRRDGSHAALHLRHHDRGHRRGFRRAPRWRARAALAGRPGGRRDRCSNSAARRARAAAPISRSRAASTCPIISAAAAPSSSARFGGHAGRALRAGDVLHLGRGVGRSSRSQRCHRPSTPTSGRSACSTARTARPISSRPADIETFFSTAWKVHYNSDRTGVRLIGPKPTWARKDGGEAGLHPSNIHDNAYAVGTVDFTGDMPVILGPDGPSLGGFVCPATIVHAELWKIGQLRPGDLVRFRRADAELARRRAASSRSRRPGRGAAAPMAIAYLLVEYGPNVLDLNLRFRVHALEDAAARRRPSRHHRSHARRTFAADSLRHRAALAAKRCSTRWTTANAAFPISTTSPPPRASSTCRSPGTTRPRSSPSASTCSPCGPTRPGAPATSNSSAASTASIRSTTSARIVFDANYLVLGLGDVYLGAPVATPVDPRHRLVTTKYNPARTWTPENAVGIGGAYLCVYGMEGPGGYQFVGRTVQMWNTFHGVAALAAALLRPDPLLRRQRRGTAGDSRRLSARRLSAAHRGARIPPPRLSRIPGFHPRRERRHSKRRQQAAFEAERERWALAGRRPVSSPRRRIEPAAARRWMRVPEGCRPVCSPVTASVWNIAVEPDSACEAGQKLDRPGGHEDGNRGVGAQRRNGRNGELRPGRLVTAGQRLVTLRQEV